MTVHVAVVSIDSPVWSGEADMVIARTTEGELGVLPNHAPLLGQLADPGQVRIRRAEGDLEYEVSGGFISVDKDGVTVLAETCRPLSEREEL